MELVSSVMDGVVDSAMLLTKVRVHPYLEFAHATLCILHLKEDITATGGGANFAKAHPMATWLCSMVTTFAGLILVALLCGEPIIGALASLESMTLASIVWYLVFYSPGDIFITIAEFFPVKIILVLLKEIFRAKKIGLGVAHALHLFPGNYLIAVLIALVKANGSGFTLALERLIRGIWAPGASEFMKPSVVTKVSIFGALLYVLESEDIITLTPESVNVIVVLLLVYLQVGGLFFSTIDPFVPVENLTCSLALGGAWEALKMAATSPTIDDKKTQ